MKKMSKRETIKTQRRMLKIQAECNVSMCHRIDELNNEIQRVKAKAFDIITERRG
jgi:hypothetical protein